VIIKSAKYPKVPSLSGDNFHPSSKINKVLQKNDGYEIVINYYTNIHKRTAGSIVFTLFDLF